MIKRLFENCAVHRHSVISDSRGNLVAIEAGTDLPFEIQRVYYLFGTAAEAERGFHAHRALHQWAVCVSGACTVLLDNGVERKEVRLDNPATGLQIGPMIWREIRDFTSDCVLIVFASAPFDEDDYIRDYGLFLKETCS